jgi:hypothetical protein
MLSCFWYCFEPNECGFYHFSPAFAGQRCKCDMNSGAKRA